ncbi:MAG: hypothetical protein ABIJ41_00690 [Candidatus Omnitrophota bacterium]
MTMRNGNEKGFASLIGMLLAIAIVAFLAYKAITTYYQKPSADQETQKTMKEQGIDTSTYRSALDSAKQKTAGIEKMMQEREDLLQKDLPR